jgi:sugar/nucleoside kinase (ribokinase family)
MFDAISVGHICIDLTPGIPPRDGGIADIFVGGKLTNVGKMEFSTGGSVSNTGIALSRLGLKTPLVGKIGDDMLGSVIADLVEKQGGIAGHLITAPGESSSYSVVLAVPGVDRIFLHNPGTNDTFDTGDVDFSLVKNARLMHFGYPPLMKKMFRENGAELLLLFTRAKDAGTATSLDMTLPDPSSESGKADWLRILSSLLPSTDIFMPSIEEIIYMADRNTYDALKSKDSDILKNLDIDYISDLGGRLIAMGCGIVVLKCGTLGYYVKTSDRSRLSQMGRAVPANMDEWADKELFSGIYKVDDFKSATGAGDTSIAGFLAAALSGYSPEDATNIACATGALCVTSYGAVDAIEPLESIRQRIKAGWEKRPVPYAGTRFEYNAQSTLYEKR